MLNTQHQHFQRGPHQLASLILIVFAIYVSFISMVQAQPALGMDPEAQKFIHELDVEMNGFLADPAFISNQDNIGVLNGLYRLEAGEDGEEIDIIRITHIKNIVMEFIVDLEDGSSTRVGAARAVSGGWRGWFSLACRGCCPGIGWWDRGSLQINSGRKLLQMRSESYKMDHDTCELTTTRDTVAIDMKLVNGLKFKEHMPGKLIHIVASPAVGNQAAQYKASVKLGWDFNGLAMKNFSLVYRGPNGGAYLVQDTTNLNYEYEFLTDRSGKYTFIGVLYDKNGKPAHFEIESITIPPIPGLGG